MLHYFCQIKFFEHKQQEMEYGEMFYFANIFLFLLIMLLTGFYVYVKSGSFITFYGGTPTKWWVRTLRAVAAVGIGYLCRNTWNTEAMFILHFLAMFLLLDGMAFVLRRFLQKWKETKFYDILHRIYRMGVVPVVLFALVIGYGFYNMNHIEKTEYNITTVKPIEDYDVVLLTDVHYDTIQNPSVLQNKIEEINACHPDVIILGGDIVEEGTSREKLEEVFAMFGKMENKHGIYFVYGNHDRQPYTSERTYTDEQLQAVIEKNGIQILRDKYVSVTDDLILAGRDDAAWSGKADRKSSEEIFTGLSQKEREKKFMLLVDHQPIEVGENGAQGVDLQLSGHTHAGQVWPVGIISEAAGILNYGMYHQGTCRAIVSSGVAGWRFPIRTGGHCEYVLVHLRPQGEV